MKKIKIHKKIIIGIIVCFVIFASAAMIGYFYFNSRYQTFSRNGISFLHLKKLKRELRIDEVKITDDGLYRRHRIKGDIAAKLPDGSRTYGSYIYIYIPLKNAEKKRILADNIKPEFAPLIKPIVINGMKGESVSYRLDEHLPRKLPIKATVTEIYLPSKYPNTPIVLFYHRSDGDPLLDDVWSVILKTIKRENKEKQGK